MPLFVWQVREPKLSQRAADTLTLLAVPHELHVPAVSLADEEVHAKVKEAHIR